MKRLVIVGSVLMAFAGSGKAQYDAQFSQYFAAIGYYNPGYVGVTEDVSIVGVQRLQWLGISGAPQSTFISAGMPFQRGKTKMGGGVALFTETIGLFRNSQVVGQFSYKKPLLGGTLSVGLQPGIASVSFDGTKVELGESDAHSAQDEAIPTENVSGMAFDLSIGIYFTHKKFYAGLASTHLLEPTVALGDNAETFIERGYNLTGGYNIQMKNPLYEVQPSVFVKTDLQSFQAEATVRLIYDKMFNGGFSWRVNESVVVLLGAVFGNIEAGYAYDFPISAVLKESSGSHELIIRYKYKPNKTKTGNYRHKSVRIL